MVAVRKSNGVSKHNGVAEKGLQSRLRSLRTDIDALQGDVMGLAGDVGDVASERVKEAVSGAAKSAKEAADRVSGRVEDWGNENMKSVRKIVRAQPFTSCALAMTAGALVMFLLRR